jgi:tRNA pseudouridine38-40 synthase
MPRFKLLIEYAGTRYRGWQIQKNARTVQGEIDQAIREVTKRREFELYGSGRTDAGVHALAQVAHLELYTDLPPEMLRRKLNDELPSDIHVRAIHAVPHKFHAPRRGFALLSLPDCRRRVREERRLVIREPIDVDAMRTARSPSLA